MTTPLITLDGMIFGRCALGVDDVMDHAVVDADGRLLVSIIDALAIVRLEADADLLLVGFADGSSHAMRLSDVVERDEVCIQLELEHDVAADRDVWLARLRSPGSGSSPTVSSIRATSFAAFVGLE